VDLLIFKYAPLESSHSIRLVHVHPAEFDDPGQISFLSTVLYTWGQTFADGLHLSESIVCDNQRLRVTSNVYDFLRRTQRRRTVLVEAWCTVPIWIDVVSINQNDASERTQQVAMMAQIYLNARRVVIWLGELDIFHPLRSSFARARPDAIESYVKPESLQVSAHDRLVLFPCF
jgi:hypothetical protein